MRPQWNGPIKFGPLGKTAGKRQVHRMARGALLTFQVETGIQTLPVRFRASNPLFQLAHMSRFDHPLPLVGN